MTEQPAISTQVTVNGQAFELKDMTAEEGKRLYDQLDTLPPEVKQQADYVAQVVVAFRSVAEVAAENHVSIKELIQRYTDKVKGQAGALDGITQEMQHAVGALEEKLASLGISGESVLEFTGLGGAYETGKGVYNAGKTATDIVQTGAEVADSVINGPGRVWNLLSAAFDAGVNFITPDFGPDEDDGKAFGAAVAVLEYQARQRLANQPAQWDNLFDRGLAYGQWGAEWALKHIPGVEWVVSHAMALWTQWFDNDQNLSYDQCLANAQAKLAALPEPDEARYRQLRTAYMSDNDVSKEVGAVLVAAKKIADVPTVPLVPIVLADETPAINTRDGVKKFEKGKDPQTLSTPGSKVNDAWEAIVGKDASAAKQTVFAAGALAGAVALPKGLYDGAVRGAAYMSNAEKTSTLGKLAANTTREAGDFLSITTKAANGARVESAFNILNPVSWMHWASSGVGQFLGRTSTGTVELVRGGVQGAEASLGLRDMRFAKALEKVVEETDLAAKPVAKAAEAAVKTAETVAKSTPAGAVNGVTINYVIEGAADAAGKAAPAAEAGAKTSTMFGIGSWLGRHLPKLSLIAPAYSTVQTLAAESGSSEQVVRGGETAALIGTAAKFGLRRLAPAAAPIMAGADLTSALIEGDDHKAVEAGTSLGIIGAFTAGGAGIGAFGGGVGAVPGAVAGAVVGGIVDGVAWCFGVQDDVADWIAGSPEEEAAKQATKEAEAKANLERMKREGISEEEYRIITESWAVPAPLRDMYKQMLKDNNIQIRASSVSVGAVVPADQMGALPTPNNPTPEQSAAAVAGSGKVIDPASLRIS